MNRIIVEGKNKDIIFKTLCAQNNAIEVNGKMMSTILPGVELLIKSQINTMETLEYLASFTSVIPEELVEDYTNNLIELRDANNS